MASRTAVGDAADGAAAFELNLGLDEQHLNSCIDCGMCLPHCPTYRVTSEEYASPRGRLSLMSAVNQTGMASQSFVEHMELCVLCLGCETACPAGVPFGDLMEQTREALVTAQPERAKAAGTKFVQLKLRLTGLGQRLALGLLAHPRLLRLCFVVLGIAQRLGLVWVAQRLGIAAKARLAKIPLRQRPLRPTPAAASSAEPVWLFTGCVMDAAMRATHLAAQTVIEAAGGQVTFPGSGAACCGALQRHAGRRAQAEKLAARTIAAMPGTAPILVDSAGCGAALKDYGRLLNTQAAQDFSVRVLDIHEWLATRQPSSGSSTSFGSDPSSDSRPDSPAVPSTGSASASVPPTKVAILDPCHLRHAQQAHESVRQTLQPALAAHDMELVELDDQGLCCGAGGAYSLAYPEIAAAIGQRKQQAIERSGAQVVVAANPGCLLHLQADLRKRGVRCCHPVELLAELS